MFYPAPNKSFADPKVTKTNIKQKIQLYFKKLITKEKIVYKDELIETNHYIDYKMLNGKKIILKNSYWTSINLPDMQIIQKIKGEE